MIGGSPCQGFSFAGIQLNFDDPRSALFFEFVRLLKEARKENPDVEFLLENVVMKKEFQGIISEYLGVQPILINSSLVSAQNRRRLYWTNIPGIQIPEDQGIKLADILIDADNGGLPGRIVGRRLNESGVRDDYNKELPIVQTVECSTNDKANCITTVSKDSMYLDIKAGLVHSEKAIAYMNRQVKGGRTHWDFNHHSDVRNDKSVTLVANLFKRIPYNVIKDWDCIRKYHPIECERLQTLPDNYTAAAPTTQRLRMCGNGWTADVIAHILKYKRQVKALDIPKEQQDAA